MIIPLGMTIWFSFQYYNLLTPGMSGFAGVENYEYLLTDPALWKAMGNTLLLVGWVSVITVVGGNAAGRSFSARLCRVWYRPSAGNFTLFCDAHRECAGVEKHDDAPLQRGVGVVGKLVRLACR